MPKARASDAGRAPSGEKAGAASAAGAGAKAKKSASAAAADAGPSTKACKPAPFHMKKALKKKLALVEKYEALKAAGKLEEFMAKRRKKVMLRDRTLVPRVRNN